MPLRRETAGTGGGSERRIDSGTQAVASLPEGENREAKWQDKKVTKEGVQNEWDYC